MSPFNLTVRLLIGYSLLQVMAPFSYAVPLSLYSLGVLLSYISMFLIGLMVPEFMATGAPRDAMAAPVYSRSTIAALTGVAILLAVVASAGISLRVADLLLFRADQFGDASGSQQSRIASLELAKGSSGTSAGAFSALAAFLSAFAIFGLVFFRHFRSILPKWLAVYLLCISPFSVFEGLAVRGGVFNLAFFGIFAIANLWGDQALRRAAFTRFAFNKPLMISVAVGFLLLGGSLFRQRIEIMAGSVDNYQVLQQGSALVIFPHWMLELARDPVSGAIFFPLQWITDYTMQSLIEFSYTAEHFYEPYQANGLVQFSLVARGITALTGLTIDPVGDIFPRVGKYGTFFSEVYMDFGIVGGMIELFIFGIAASLVYRASQAGKATGLILLPLVMTSIAVAPLVNILASSRIYFILAGLMLVWPLSGALAEATRPRTRAPVRAASSARVS